MESELFGHEKGSFTGASGRREGRFEQANGGTLFLDEIGDMPHDTQTRLLRVLAEGEFYRVGGASAIKTDVRVIAATHQDLRNLVEQGSFREDLYHRLNVIGINVPRLSERSEDIPLLLNHFLSKAASELGVPTKEVSAQVRDYLSALEWPGNVRQLENTCRWLTVMAAGNTILMNDLPPELTMGANAEAKGSVSWEKQLSDWVRAKLLAGETNVLKQAMPQIESIIMNAAPCLDVLIFPTCRPADLVGPDPDLAANREFRCHPECRARLDFLARKKRIIGPCQLVEIKLPTRRLTDANREFISRFCLPAQS